MTLNDALPLMKKGEKVRRTDWMFSVDAFITLDESNHALQFYIHNKYNHNQYGDEKFRFEGYGMAYADVISENWEIVN